MIPLLSVWAEGSKLFLHCPYADRNKAKNIGHCRYDRKAKSWVFPLQAKYFKAIVATWPEIYVKNDVLAILNELRYEFKALQKFKKVALLEPDQDYSAFLSLPFFDHQLRTFTFFKGVDRSADFSEPGAGKTAVQIGLLLHRILEQKIDKALIIAPLSILKRVWFDDLNKFAGGKFPWTILIMDKSVAQTEKMLTETKDMNHIIYVMNYEKTWRVLPLLERAIPDPKRAMVILDESSRIKNPSSKQTKAILKLRSFKYKSILTGTPTPNDLMEAFAQLEFLDDRLLGDNFYAFREKYFWKIDEFQWAPKTKTADHLKMIMDVYSVSWKKKDCHDLPPLTVQTAEAKMSKDQKKAYDMMAEEMVALIDESVYDASITLTKLLRLSQITSGFLQNTEGSDRHAFKPNPKLNLLIELMKDIPPDKKVIIWAIFHDDIQAIQKALQANKMSSVAYYGSVSKKGREKALSDFIDGDSRCFIAHPKSAGMGLNLSVASYSIRYSMNYSYEDYAQSIERFNRTGQTDPMTEYTLIMKGTVDEAIFDAIKNKKKVNDFITDFKDFHKMGNR
jgi:SNF2 family DNA or RNA helicase